MVVSVFLLFIWACGVYVVYVWGCVCVCVCECECSTYVEQAAEAQHGEQGVHVTLASEVQSGSHVPSRTRHTVAVPATNIPSHRSTSVYTKRYPVNDPGLYSIIHYFIHYNTDWWMVLWMILYVLVKDVEVCDGNMVSPVGGQIED